MLLPDGVRADCLSIFLVVLATFNRDTTAGLIVIERWQLALVFFSNFELQVTYPREYARVALVTFLRVVITFNRGARAQRCVRPGGPGRLSGQISFVWRRAVGAAFLRVPGS